MNVFHLDDDPRTAAAYHVDAHVSKMILEGVQILNTALHENGASELAFYRPTHAAHPCVEWAAASRANWADLYELVECLNDEFAYRGFDAPHASYEKAAALDPDAVRAALPDVGPTERPQCMPDEYERPGDPVGAYRAYYAGEKRDIAEWTARSVPPFMREALADDPASVAADAE